jgi:ferredoxin
MEGNENGTAAVATAAAPTAADSSASRSNGEDHGEPTSAAPDETISGWLKTLREGDGTRAGASGLPVLPGPVTEQDEEQADSLLRKARAFHRGDPVAAGELQKPGEDLLPALLCPFQDGSAIRHEYPLFLYPAGEVVDGRAVAPLSAVLEEAVASFAPDPEDARILKDNLRRLERKVQASLADSVAPVNGADAVSAAAQDMIAELSLRPENAHELGEAVQRMVQALPGAGRLLAFGEHAPVALLTHAVRLQARERRLRLRKELRRLSARLHEWLRVERGKGAEARRPDVVKASVGDRGADLVDAEALSRVMGPARGSKAMDSGRVKRIEHTLSVIDHYVSADEPAIMTIVHGAEVPEEWKTGASAWHSVDDGGVCAAATEVFDGQAAHYKELFGAMRVARIELAGAYEPARHDPLLESFDWTSFTEEELAALPPVVALESAPHLAGAGMADLSRLLLSGRPVQVVVPVQPATNPGVGETADPLSGYRFELGYLGLGYREALVNQSSAARAEHLVKGFLAGLEGTRPGLHVVSSALTAGGDTPRLGAWLHAGAALEGRAHAFFHYDPRVGSTWARRFDFDGNPQPEADWPVYALPCRTAADQAESLFLGFTFADFALLEPRYRDHFRTAPAELGEKSLVVMDGYLALPRDRAAECVPFVWATDAGGNLHRLLVSDSLTAACRDRLQYWRTLQELAGVRNAYVGEAVAHEHELAEARLAEEIAALESKHAAELDKVRAEAAGEAMQRLAETLLGTDVSALAVAAPPSAPRAAAARAAAPAAAAPEEAVVEAPPAPGEEEEEEGAEEAWIDSVLCTTCNDCTDINPQLFVYNANKQAVIGDIRAGTYAQLVQAAEKCPSKCIHPGKPLDPNEPNLDQLVARAKPFN